jgi:[NiFe] hydrogenase diaphorase moiety large subunit
MAEQQSALIKQIVGRFGKDRTRLMDILHAVQAKLGYLSEDTMEEIAQALGVNLVEVRDTASFYAFFTRVPKGKYVVRVCNAVVERMHGADEVAAAFEKAAGASMGGSSKDGLFTLEHTPCIGMSDQPASVLVNGVPLTGLAARDVPGIVAALREGKDPAKLPQADIDLNLQKSGPVVFAPMDRGAAVRKAVNMKPEEVINQITQARLRGRGGAGFPTGMKWDFCRKAQGNAHYIICNADEGEPGTFKDRVILTEQADLVFEGMTVGGYAIGARQGLLYLRGEYAYLLPHLEQVLEKRRRFGLLGENVCGREGFSFDIRIQLGAGAYVCGEESSLIESLEGKRGAPRDRPPFPVQKGYLGEPTAVNNVETLCCAARILEKGAGWFSQIGTKDSTGTKLLSISGDVRHAGVYELDYGITVEKMLEMVGAENAQAVQIGGPSGQCLAPKDYGRCISFEDVPTGGSVIVFRPGRDLLGYIRDFTEFFVEESCGWCVPCRVGTKELLLGLEKILDGRGTQADLDALEVLGNTVKTMSRCGLGQTAANPILTSMRSFPELYHSLLSSEAFIPRFDLAKALEEGCAITGRTPELEGEHV